MRIINFKRLLFSWQILCTAILLLLSPLAMAADVATGTGLLDKVGLFTPPITDKSVHVLGEIFGSVGSVLHGTSGQLLGNLFEVLNYGILSIAILFLIYSVVTSVIYTASDGEVMGRGTSTSWAALRIVFGLGMLVPKAGGYSMIQIFIMWVVVQGVGFADATWNKALDYLEAGHAVYVPSKLPVLDVQMMGQLFQQQVCMYKTEQMAQTKQKFAEEQLKKFPNNPLWKELARPVPPFRVFDATNLMAFYFPGTINDITSFKNEITKEGSFRPPLGCGRFPYGSLQPGTINNPEYRKGLAVKHTALAAAITSLDPIAREMAKLELYRYPNGKPDFRKNVTDAQLAVMGLATRKIIEVTQTFADTLKDKPQAPGAIDPKLKAYYDKAREEGWVMAGRYYFALGNVEDTTFNLPKHWLGWLSGRASYDLTHEEGHVNDLPPKARDAVEDRLGFNNEPSEGWPNDEYYQIVYMAQVTAEQTVEAAKTLNGMNNVKYDPLTAGSLGRSQEEQETTAIMQSMFDIVNGTFGEFGAYFSGQNTQGADPILALQHFGNQLLAGVTKIWVIGLGTMAGVSIIASLYGAFSSGAWVLLEIVFWFVPMLTAVTTALFTSGLVMAVYIPLMPYILFLFGAIGWLISVIEAMVAGPLVALGVTHPKGHDWLGKAEQATMLLLSVFLRPVLMVIGLLAAMILSRVAFGMLNSGFSGVSMDISVEGLSGNSMSILMGPIMMIAMLIVYVSLVMSVATACFQLINVLPDKVMRWLGVQPDHSNIAQEAASSAKGAVQATGQQIGQGAGGAMQKGADDAKENQKAAKSKQGGGGSGQAAL